MFFRQDELDAWLLRIKSQKKRWPLKVQKMVQEGGGFGMATKKELIEENEEFRNRLRDMRDEINELLQDEDEEDDYDHIYTRSWSYPLKTRKREF